MTGLPASWTMTTLGDLAAGAPRAITDGPFGSNLTSAHYTDSGPQVVRLQNIGDGAYIRSSAHIAPGHFETLKKHEVTAGDLLVASLGEVLPRACLAPEDLGPAIVKADCIRIRLSEDVDAKWVLFALQRPSVRRWAEDHRHGVGRPRLGLKGVRELPVPVAPLAEQRRVVALLEDQFSRLDAAEDYLNASAKRLVRLRQAMLSSKLDAPDRISVLLGALVERVEAGRSFGGPASRATSEQWGIIKVSAMTWGSFRPEENKAVDSAKADPKYEIQHGDLLVSRANTTEHVGASVLVGAVRPRLLLSDKSLRIVPNAKTSGEWLQLALSSPRARAQLSARASGTKDSMRNISQAGLLATEVADVPVDVQQTDIAALRQHQEASELLREQLLQAQHRREGLRRALLAAAFSGQLTGRSSDLDIAEELAEVNAQT